MPVSVTNKKINEALELIVKTYLGDYGRFAYEAYDWVIPADLIDKLARSLFVTDETKDIDIHPAETLFTALFGKAGGINVEFPGKFRMERSESADGKKKEEKTGK
jgi:hypothetical protein